MKEPSSPTFAAFSLVETVLALGIFAFCIVVLLGLMPVGLRSARSVANESNAVNIGQSILAAWAMQKNKAQDLRLPPFLSNSLPPLNQALPEREIFFDDFGNEVESAEVASLKLSYSVELPEPDVATVRMRFAWPPLAPPETVQTRDLVQSIRL